MSNFVLTGPDVLPRVDDFVAREQIVLILCGLIASGKVEDCIDCGGLDVDDFPIVHFRTGA